jgi:hypothetical protein
MCVVLSFFSLFNTRIVVRVSKLPESERGRYFRANYKKTPPTILKRRPLIIRPRAHQFDTPRLASSSSSGNAKKVQKKALKASKASKQPPSKHVII